MTSTVQTLTHRAVGFIETEISRQEQRLAALEQQRDAALAQRQTAIVSASQAADAITAEERRRSGISADEPKSPYQRGGVFIEAMTGIAEAMAHHAGEPWLAAAMASDTAYKLTQQLNGLSTLIGSVRKELGQLQREEHAALHASGQPARGWASPTALLLSKPGAAAGGIG